MFGEANANTALPGLEQGEVLVTLTMVDHAVGLVTSFVNDGNDGALVSRWLGHLLELLVQYDQAHVPLEPNPAGGSDRVNGPALMR